MKLSIRRPKEFGTRALRRFNERQVEREAAPPAAIEKESRHKTAFLFDGNLADLLSAMSAVRAYVSGVKGASAHIFLKDGRYVHLLQDAWFAKSVTHVREPGNKFEPSGLDHVVRLKVDREECEQAELSERAALKAQIDQQIEEVAAQLGCSPDKIQKPPDYSLLESKQPNWTKIQGYAYLIAKETGTNFPLACAEPYFPAIHHVSEKAREFLHKNKREVGTGPFVIIDGIDHYDKIGAGLIYPSNWGCFIVEPDTDLCLAVGLMSHRRCAMVIGPVAGGFTRMAWAGKVEVVVETLKDVEHPYWEVSRGRNVITENLSGPSAPENFVSTLKLIYATKFRIEVE